MILSVQPLVTYLPTLLLHVINCMNVTSRQREYLMKYNFILSLSGGYGLPGLHTVSKRSVGLVANYFHSKALLLNGNNLFFLEMDLPSSYFTNIQNLPSAIYHFRISPISNIYNLSVSPISIELPS